MILDVRTPEEYSEGHVMGAVNISVGEISHAKLPVDLEDPIAVYCKTGRRALPAKEILEARGFTNVTLWNNDGKFEQQ